MVSVNFYQWELFLTVSMSWTTLNYPRTIHTKKAKEVWPLEDSNLWPRLSAVTWLRARSIFSRFFRHFGWSLPFWKLLILVEQLVSSGMTPKNAKNVSSAVFQTPFETDDWLLYRELLGLGTIVRPFRHCAKQGGRCRGYRAPYKLGGVLEPYYWYYKPVFIGYRVPWIRHQCLNFMITKESAHKRIYLFYPW